MGGMESLLGVSHMGHIRLIANGPFLLYRFISVVKMGEKGE
jgi:hypothetical protein